VVGVVVAAAGLAARAGLSYAHDDSRRHYLGATGWPASGQASYALGQGPIQSSPGQTPAPIASLAKVMTALVVLRHDPLPRESSGIQVVITADDVADFIRRAAQDQSVLPVRSGERLTERQALIALLLPSANNIAEILARAVDGSRAAFVAEMNRTALGLGMRHTHYTDPSGYLASTTSTAADQVRLAQRAMRDPTVRAIVGLTQARLPVVGVVHNTDTLLGVDGFRGVKTGSMDASGGCFMFAAGRRAGSRTVTITGVVLGQPGHNLIDAGLDAARQFADRVLAGPPD
jgi:D-alanyl-D-alanine carboxypeptidase (penicillin-binding protein 5/6)